MKLQIFADSEVELSEIAKEYVENKINKLSRYLPSIQEAKVEISRERAKQPEQRFIVQATLDCKGVLIRAEEKSRDIRTAVDKVSNVLSKRIQRYKGKLYDKGRGISLARQEARLESEQEAPKKVVKTKHFLIKPMSLEEAINQMELLGHDFFLFIDSDSEKLNLLYRRRDGNYGLIQPEQA